MNKHPECDKMVEKTDEWNVIYPFMEWLQENGRFLCRNDTEEDARARGDVSEKTGEAWVREHPIPIFKTIEQLLYEYFDVDPAKLEQERRKILEELREK